MTQGIEFLELIFGQLHEAGVVRSKGEFSERLLGKSPSYLTSMRSKQRIISSYVVMGLGDNLMAEIAELGSEAAFADRSSTLRRAAAQVNNYLADQIIPEGVALSQPLRGQETKRRSKGLFGWLRALVMTSST